MEVVNVLGDDAYQMLRGKLSQGKMGGIWFSVNNLAPTEIVKLQNPLWVISESPRGADFFDAVSAPKPVFISKSL
jgi:hypothetical protein